MSACDSRFKFVELISENGQIKAKINEKEGPLSLLGAVYTLDERGVYDLANTLFDTVETRRHRINKKELLKAFDAIRNAKLKSKIQFDVAV